MFDDTKDIVGKIMKQPDAVLIVNSVQERLKSEHQKRQEFYESITEDDKVEFINGEIVFHSPVIKRHNTATGLLYKLMDTFVSMNELGFVGIEKIMVKFTRNDYEPDVCFFNKEKSDKFKEDQMLFPIPDLVVEVLSKSKKSLKRDKETKFEDYEKHGVPEYWMVDAENKTVEQHLLKKGKYKLELKSSEGMVTSRVIKGFSVPIPAIFDEQKNLEALRKILK